MKLKILSFLIINLLFLNIFAIALQKLKALTEYETALNTENEEVISNAEIKLKKISEENPGLDINLITIKNNTAKTIIPVFTGKEKIKTNDYPKYQIPTNKQRVYDIRFGMVGTYDSFFVRDLLDEANQSNSFNLSKESNNKTYIVNQHGNKLVLTEEQF